jgi:hypothetical protein
VIRAVAPVTRYSIVNGCYSLRTPSGRVGLVSTTAHGYRAGGRRVGQRRSGKHVVRNGSRRQILSDACAAGVS